MRDKVRSLKIKFELTTVIKCVVGRLDYQ